ncbi:hypothetical protein GS8_1655 [Geobacillus stearothermophilus]|uniref:Uncharacterized protein n=1 Tax=Geobacillus stearothermophilus TaxID=1422 RepID=A0ABQ7HFJ2_GEOSE|nr:hypothetical protein GS8_1655 [Geobacillus stearothermophilus]
MSLSLCIRPGKGVRFSPYGHVNPGSDIVFKKIELPFFNNREKQGI